MNALSYAKDVEVTFEPKKLSRFGTMIVVTVKARLPEDRQIDMSNTDALVDAIETLAHCHRPSIEKDIRERFRKNGMSWYSVTYQLHAS